MYAIVLTNQVWFAQYSGVAQLHAVSVLSNRRGVLVCVHVNEYLKSCDEFSYHDFN